MNRDLLEWLTCPADGWRPLDLVAADSTGSRIENGELRCRSCGTSYPIVTGIPSFLAADLSELQRHEKEAREREYGARERYESDVQRLPELDAVRSALGDCAGLWVLDAGCGTGGMIQVLGSSARTAAIDFSRSGLLAHPGKGSPSVDLIQGDITRLPFRDDLFDAAISTGVFHHLPSKAERAAFLGHLRRTLKPGGKLVLTTFHWNAHHRAKGNAKAGFFDNGIFCRRFEVEELREELAAHFDVDAIVPVQIVLPKTYRLVQALGRRNVGWDRFWRRVGLSKAYSNLLLASCRKR